MWQVKIDTLEKKNNFYSHIPCGMWLKSFASIFWGFSISTHTSRVGCDIVCADNNTSIAISTHTSRVGCDEGYIGKYSLMRISTHTSRVGCDKSEEAGNIRYQNFYSHIPCGMWRTQQHHQHVIYPISTHTSRVGCDCKSREEASAWIISTHTSRVGCDCFGIRRRLLLIEFLLTHPVWDVTSWIIK